MSDYKNDGKFTLKTKQERNKEFKQYKKETKNKQQEQRKQQVKKYNQKKAYKNYQKDKRAGFVGGVKSGLSTVALLFLLILFNSVINMNYNFVNRSRFNFNFSKNDYNKGSYYNQYYSYDNKIKFVNFENFTWNYDAFYQTEQSFVSSENYIITISSKGSFEGKLTLILKGEYGPFYEEDIIFTFETVKDFENFVWNWEYNNAMVYREWYFTFEDFTTKNLELTFRSIRLTQNYELTNGGYVVGVFEETINVITNTIDFTMGLVNSIYVVLDGVVDFIVNLVSGGA